MAVQTRFDALLPAEIAQLAEQIGITKAKAGAVKVFVLAILAGAFIALGAVFATTVGAGAGDAGMPYGVTRLLVGLVFCLGLILVVLAGAELFTGNNLIVLAWASGKISLRALLRNWVIVYAGNFVGAVATALLMLASRQYEFGGGGIGTSILAIAEAKCSLDPVQAVVLGMMCNALVCLAVWLTYSAHTTVDKITAIIFPITAFVAAGFEHSVANMYFVPIGLFIKQADPAFVAASGVAVPNLTWGQFLVGNLLPVTLGNIIGGVVMVAAVYWFVYLRNRD